ncbi:MAG: AAA family ATPase [Natronomonas sp.]
MTNQIRESTTTEVATAGRTAHDVIANVQQVIVGGDEPIEHLVAAVLGGGHVLLADVPGVGKTMLARAIAASFDCTFKRIQFTPDLLPADITGSNVYNQETGEFEFRPGPVFANVVLADEINRAPPKTQAALLEAMEEGQVTIDGRTRSVPTPFVVIATKNTIDRERTYELPAAELDRFMLRLELGYPDLDDESTVIDRAVGGHAIDGIEPVSDVEQFDDARSTTAAVAVREPLRRYVSRLTGYTRDHARLGASPRASIALVRAGQGHAVLDGRDYVLPDDVQELAHVVLPHRMQTAPQEPSAADVVSEALEEVPVDPLEG